MGKIFGISDLPVSTIMSPFEPPMDFRSPVGNEADFQRKNPLKDKMLKADTYCSKQPKTNSNPFVKMRNGFGKLMEHFSKKI